MNDEQIETRIREILDDYDVGPSMRASGSIPWEADLEALRAALLSLFREARDAETELTNYWHAKAVQGAINLANAHGEGTL